MRIVLEYEFRCGTKTAEAVRNVNRVLGEGSTNKVTGWPMVFEIQ